MKNRSAEDAHIGMLIKLATEHPQIRSHVLPVIQQHTASVSAKTAATIKTAFSEESEQFVAWCIMKNDKLSVNECQRILDKLGVPMQEEGVKQTRGPLEKGEMVRCDAKKNTNQLNTQVCEQFDGKVGHVVDVDGDALVVEFTDAVRNYGKGRFEGKESGSKTGLYRYTPSDAGGANERAMVECIYIKDPASKPNADRIDQIQEYVQQGADRGENRSRIYYSGNPLKQGMGKNGYYFTVFSAQRDQFPTSINPAKGQVLYLGRMGGRPGGWKAEFARMVAAAEQGE